jgi:peptidoglycan/xylan/chitin deacetylase (PgdA/CDA1 family)
MPADKKELYLTFDDGPVPGTTEFVLHTLARLSVKATFFCIGDNIQKHPDIFKRIINEGHAVGNHTFNHLNGWKTKSDVYLKNIQSCEHEIKTFSSHHAENIFTNKAKLFRPPYGRITPKQIAGLTDYKIVMWDVLSKDYDKNQAPHHCLLHTVNATRTGSIIVFHDSYKAERSMAFALPRYIEHFLAKGFVFKTIPE